MREKKIICLLTGILLGIFVGVVLIGSGVVDAKKVLRYKGRYIASSYTPATNTPRGSHQTWSGHRAKEGVTVAVDDRTPIAGMGDKIVLEWKTEKGKTRREDYKVQDRGHFGHLNGGKRQLDVFFEHRGWGLRWVKVYVYGKETKAERRVRLRRERLRRQRIKEKKQRQQFNLVYDPTLLPWQVVTDKDIISGGVIRLKWQWLDVVRTERGLGSTIKCGDRSCMFGKMTHIGEIREEAVG